MTPTMALNGINGLGGDLSPEDRIRQQQGVGGTQGPNATPATGHTTPNAAAGQKADIADPTVISGEARTKLAQEALTKPFVAALKNAATTDDTLSQARVERFKQLIAEGGIGQYLEEAIPKAASALLASPTRKALG
jgi:hypothetical protein